ncbi:hypothetical protein [Deinococcus navajonensis]|uniref:Uncharacterized protein n=1 Tax=Deinococcus navajonensis TaxID=309884 RepID=A0ABV8XKY1_9DEIO
MSFSRSTLLTAVLLLSLGSVTAQTTPPATPTPPAQTDPAPETPPTTETTTPTPSTEEAALPAQTTLTLASGPLTLPYLTGATPVRSIETVSGVAVFYSGDVADAMERYAETLTAAGFTVVSSETIPSRAPAAGGTTDTANSTEEAEAADAPATTEGATPPAAEGAGTGSAASGAAGGSGAPAGTGNAGDTSTGGTTDAAGSSDGAAAGSTETAAAAQSSGSDRQVMILERNGERIRVSVWQMYGLTTVLLARA